MKKSVIFTVLLSVCAALPLAAQIAAPDGAERKRDSAQPQEMVLIPAGEFWMGRTQTAMKDAVAKVQRYQMDDRPANLIDLDAFYMDKYEVTNEDYAKFIKATAARAPWHWPEGVVAPGKERQAVSNVNWFDADAYCKWAGKRLPTEAEWEKAARGGLDRKFYTWGDSPDGVQKENGTTAIPANINHDEAINVGTFAPNGYGLYDMTGNVLEWTHDWYDFNYYPFMPKKNPQGPETGKYKSVRGGGWSDNKGDKLAAYFREYSDPELRGSTIGFRCAK
jgi:formylglycine-generating enzyme required for sulfatase activity